MARTFGDAFAAALAEAAVGRWSGPVPSSFGVHYVRVTERAPGVEPALADVREPVAREWEAERRRRARDDAYAKLRRAYRVDVQADLRGR